MHFIQENSPGAAVRVYKDTVPPRTKDCASADGRFQVSSLTLHVSENDRTAMLNIHKDTWPYSLTMPQLLQESSYGFD